MSNFYPPRPGEIIFLTCLDCKNMFKGPNPGNNNPLRFLFPPVKKTRCPDCGGKKVVPHPAIHY